MWTWKAESPRQISSTLLTQLRHCHDNSNNFDETVKSQTCKKARTGLPEGEQFLQVLGDPLNLLLQIVALYQLEA